MGSSGGNSLSFPPLLALAPEEEVVAPRRRSPFDLLALSVRSAIPALAVVGTAVMIAAVPISVGGNEAAAAEKAILFLVAIRVLPMTDGPPALAFNSDPMTGLTSTIALLIGMALLPTGALGIPSPVRLLSVLVAASVEEIVYRQILPRAIAERLVVDLGGRRAMWTGIAGAQVAFALSHLVNGVPHRAASLIQLGSEGILLAVLRQAGGLPLAILAHTIANLAIGAKHLPF